MKFPYGAGIRPVIGYVERFITVNILHTEQKPECGIVDCPCHGEDVADQIAGCPTCLGEYIPWDDQRRCRQCGMYECPLCQASHEAAFDLRWMAGETGAIARIARDEGVAEIVQGFRI